MTNEEMYDILCIGGKTSGNLQKVSEINKIGFLFKFNGCNVVVAMVSFLNFL
mgnify:CR=1 FL=1